MSWDVILTLAGIIIYVTAYVITDGRIAGRRGFGRYGTWGMQDDFSIDYDPLSDIRDSFDRSLKLYYANNQPKTYLKNKNCEAKLIKEKNGNMYFYVKERSNFNTAGNYFEVKGNNVHVSTMWAIIDMEFGNLTRYQDIKQLYITLNQGYNTRGGMKYFKETRNKKLPSPITNQFAQNEFCKMEIQTLGNGTKVLVCSEIWGSVNYNEIKQFVVNGDKLVLYDILSKFSKNQNKMEDYTSLLANCVKRTDCTVKEIPAEPPQTTENPTKKENSAKQEEYNSGMKILHVNIKETPSESIQKQKEKTNTKQNIENQNSNNINTSSELEIKKYNERNIDF